MSEDLCGRDHGAFVWEADGGQRPSEGSNLWREGSSLRREASKLRQGRRRKHGAKKEGAGLLLRRTVLACALIAATTLVGVAQDRPAVAERQATVYSRYSVQNFRSYVALGKPIDAEKPDYALLNAALYFVTNEARVREGKSAVAYHPLLEKTAFDYAREMVTKDFFDHDHPSDPSQRGPSDRGKRAGIKNASLAENIATGFGIQYEAGKPIYIMDATKGVFSYISSKGPALPMHTYLSLAQSLVDQWMNSPGHRANMLNAGYTRIGPAAYTGRNGRIFWCLQFLQ